MSLMVHSTVSFAETIKLKSGKVIEGKIVEKTKDYIKVDTGIGTNLTYYTDSLAEVPDSKESAVNNDEVTMTISALNMSDAPVPDIEKGDSDNTVIKKSLNLVNALKTFDKEVKMSQVIQVFSKGNNQIAKRVTDIYGELISMEGAIPDGAVKEYENGKLKSEGTFKDNQPIGPWKEYYSNDQLKMVTNYENGKKNGEYKFYFLGGKVRGGGTFENNKRVGVEKRFDESGKLSGEIDYRDKNYESIVKAYAEDGTSVVMYMKDGASVGYRTYDKSGNVLEDKVRE